MHSRIFEVVNFKDASSYIRSNHVPMSAYEFEDCFDYDRFWDYVGDDENKSNSITWLAESYPDFVAGNIFEITNVNAESYFKIKLDKLKSLVDNITIESFAGSDKNDWVSLYEIRDCINKEYGFYFVAFSEDDECWGLYTLDEFVRNNRGKFDIVNSFDYHF